MYLEDLIKLLKPFQILTQIVQKDIATIGDVHAGFVDLISSVSSQQDGKYKDYVEDFQTKICHRWYVYAHLSFCTTTIDFMRVFIYI